MVKTGLLIWSLYNQETSFLISIRRLKETRVDNDHFETRHSKPLQDNDLELGGVDSRERQEITKLIQLLRCIVQIKIKNSVMLNICLNNHFYQWLSHTGEHIRVAYGSWLAARSVYMTRVQWSVKKHRDNSEQRVCIVHKKSDEIRAGEWQI